MSNHKRKRRRSGEAPAELSGQTMEASTEAQDPTEENEQAREAKLEKDRDLWDAFREEYYEGQTIIGSEKTPYPDGHVSYRAATVDVASTIYADARVGSASAWYHLFPILRRTLHSSHAVDYNEKLLPALYRYVSHRKTLSQSQFPPPSAEANAQHPATPRDISRAPSASAPSPRATSAVPNEATALSAHQVLLPAIPTPITVQTPAASISTPRTSTPAVSIPSERPEPVKTTREMLSQMSQLSEEILRASEEKVNLAQVAYDSVRRNFVVSCKEKLRAGVGRSTHTADRSSYKRAGDSYLYRTSCGDASCAPCTS
jgi:hypothetical protein